MSYEKDLKLLFSIIKPNNINPELKLVYKKGRDLFSTDLETVVILKNVNTPPEGAYNKTQMQIKNYEQSQNVSNHPDINKFDFKADNSLTIKSNTLKRLIESTLFAADKTKKNLSLRGLHFNVSFDTLTVVATDTYRMKKTVINDISGEEFKFLLPTHICKILLADLILDNSFVHIDVKDGYIKVRYLNREIIGKTLPLRFPDYKTIFNNVDADKKVTVVRKDMLEALKKIELVSKSRLDKYAFELILNRCTLTLKAFNNDCSCRFEVEALSDVESFITYLNSRFFLEYLKISKNEVVKISFSESGSIIVIDDEYLMMPVRY